MIKRKSVSKKAVKKPATKKKAKSTKTPTRRIKKPTEPTSGTYMGLFYESFVELSALFWAEELINAGYIVKVERSPSFVLVPAVYNNYVEKLKTKNKDRVQSIMNDVVYTPDYDFYFRKEALGLFIWDIDSATKCPKNLFIAQKDQKTGLYRVCVEVKPDFSRNNQTVGSVVKMKWLYQTHGVFTNLFKPDDIHKRMFCSAKYMVTKLGTIRKIKYPFVSLQSYIKSKK